MGPNKVLVDMQSNKDLESAKNAAIEASKPQWDGEGLPPVGCGFLFGTHRTMAKCIAVGYHMLFASKGNPDDEDGEYEEFIISIPHSEFYPIRSEADKKRDDAVKALRDIIGGPGGPLHK